IAVRSAFAIIRDVLPRSATEIAAGSAGESSDGKRRVASAINILYTNYVLSGTRSVTNRKRKMGLITDGPNLPRRRTPLNRSQIAGFWRSWTGWTLDGMDSFIYALVLTPALTELLPKSGIAATPGNLGLAGSILFALFLVGWGLSFIWGPIADRFGRTKVLAATIFTFAIFTGLSAAAQNVWELATFRFIAGVGIGGEWALAGTYVAEAWPEDRRK